MERQLNPAEFRIPIIDWPSDVGGYRGIPVDSVDPRNSEPLVDVSALGIAAESHYARIDGGNWPYNQAISGSLKRVWARKGVVERLVRINQRLAPMGFELFVWDGYRPIETQSGLWDYFEAAVRRERPVAGEADIEAAVVKYVSDPRDFRRDDSTTWPAHSTGGALDLTLRDRATRQLLDMGAAFDEMAAISHSDALERHLAAGDIKETNAPLTNRRILHWAMSTEGFVNYPLEYWHFDWGNQFYVHNLGVEHKPAPAAAWYGYVDPPTSD